MEEIDKKIGEELRKLRQEKKLSTRKVGEKIRIDHSYVSKIENGKIPSVATLKKLCDLYGITVASLFGEEGEPPRELKELGVKWVSFAKEMEQKELTPTQIKQIIEAVKLMNNL